MLPWFQKVLCCRGVRKRLYVVSFVSWGLYILCFWRPHCQVDKYLLPVRQTFTYWHMTLNILVLFYIVWDMSRTYCFNIVFVFLICKAMTIHVLQYNLTMLIWTGSSCGYIIILFRRMYLCMFILWKYWLFSTLKLIE